MPDPSPRTPDEAYRAIIDQLAEHSKVSVTANRVRGGAPFPETMVCNPGPSAINALQAALTPEHRETLAQMLVSERTGGVHDALVTLEWWASTGEVAATFRGEPIDLDRYEGPHSDFVGRLEGWEWPV